MGQPEPQDRAFDYDIAVSFASEDREYVHDLVERLKAKGVSVFYDEDALAEIWGVNLIDFLRDVYNRRARYALIFISKHYVAKKWTGYERQSAQDRALEQASTYILPVRLDDSELPGLHSSIAYVDARRFGISELTQLVLKKLSGPDGSIQLTQVEPAFNGRVPRNAEEIEMLLAARPAAWEYLLYAALLLDGNRKLDHKYQDHMIRYSPRSGRSISDDEVASELSRRLDEMESIIEFFNRLLAEEVQEAAFGRPGEPGDPDRIRHIATRMCSVEEDLFDWAASVHATTVSNASARKVFEALAHFADQPIEAIRHFIDDFVSEADTMHQRVIDGEHINLSMTVTLEIPDAVSQALARATDRFRDEHL